MSQIHLHKKRQSHSCEHITSNDIRLGLEKIKRAQIEVLKQLRRDKSHNVLDSKRTSPNLEQTHRKDEVQNLKQPVIREKNSPTQTHKSVIENTLMRTLLTDPHQQNQQLRNEISFLRSELLKIQHQLHTKTIHLQQMQSQNQKLHNQRVFLEQNLKNISSENTQLYQRLHTADSPCHTIREEQKDQESKRKYKYEYRRQKEKNKDLSIKFDELLKCNKELQAHMKKMQKKYELEVEKKKCDYQNLQLEIQSLTKNNLQEKKQWKDMLQTLYQHQKHIKQLQLQNQNHKQTIQKLNEQLFTIKKDQREKQESYLRELTMIRNENTKMMGKANTLKMREFEVGKMEELQRLNGWAQELWKQKQKSMEGMFLVLQSIRRI